MNASNAAVILLKLVGLVALETFGAVVFRMLDSDIYLFTRRNFGEKR